MCAYIVCIYESLWPIGLLDRVFTNGQLKRGSIPGCHSED